MVLLRLETCMDRDGWKLSQTDGPQVLPASLIFPARADAVEFAKQRCATCDCLMVIRGKPDDASLRLSA